MELVIGAAFEATLGFAPTGPEILLFKRFHDSWQQIDQGNFQPASTDETVEAAVSGHRAELLLFAKSQAPQVRDDYQELLHLVIIFLGGVPEKGVKFRAPGAMHRARWMAKVLYAIKCSSSATRSV